MLPVSQPIPASFWVRLAQGELGGSFTFLGFQLALAKVRRNLTSGQLDASAAGREVEALFEAYAHIPEVRRELTSLLREAGVR